MNRSAILYPVHSVSCPIFMVSMMHLPLFFGNVPEKGTLAEPPILLLFGESIKSFCSVFLELLGELLSGQFRFVPMKADGGSSVEVPSSAGSVVAFNVSVRAVFKIVEEIEVQSGHPSCRSLIVFFLGLIGFLLHRFFRSTASFLDSFLNLRALAFHPLPPQDISVQLICQLTDLPPLRELP